MYLELYISGTLETRDIFTAKWPLGDRSQEHHPIPALFSPPTPDLFCVFLRAAAHPLQHRPQAAFRPVLEHGTSQDANLAGIFQSHC